MGADIVIGAQWGDEGKGKLTDILAETADGSIKPNGGGNAGHTVIDETGMEVIFHYLSSAMMRPNIILATGPGSVVNPKCLMNERAAAQNMGLKLDDRFFVDERVSMLMPYHRIQDFVEEWTKSKQGGKIGTTGHGIGPAYTDQANRHTDIMFVDFIKGFEENFFNIAEDKISLFRGKNGVTSDVMKGILQQLTNNQLRDNKSLLEKGLVREEDLDYNKYFDKNSLLNYEIMYEELLRVSEHMKPYLTNTSHLANRLISEGKKIVLEASQGHFLDKIYGTRKFVTSSHPISQGAVLGSGISPMLVDRIFGVVKAYVTRVGAGPFPTKFEDSIAEKIRQIGKEYGATTGRPRDCGYFDGVMARTAQEINGFTHLAITKLDVLTGMEQIPVCYDYELDGEVLETYPASISDLERVNPIVEIHPGWKEDITSARKYAGLPKNAKRYVDVILEEHQRAYNAQDLKIGFISVGPRRDQVIKMF
ncbi:adenylosuccinate synthetase [Candidatus Woesearchaeota archaeon]|nr:adenylosuccinate synthetase [Candidatus Woesearchaeota archaeon]